MIKSLESIALYLLDLDGTLYVGNGEIAGAFDTVKQLRALGKQVCFLTNNSSRSTSEHALKLQKMGLSASENDFVSSTKSTMHYLKKHYANKSLCLVATPSVRDEFLQNGFTLLDDGEIAVLTFDTTLDYKKITSFTNRLMAGAPYIATHPDMTCPYAPYNLVDIGSFMLMFAGTTGRRPDVICGKPSPIMAEYVTEHFDCPAENIAMCGDRLYTDIRFGIDNGFTSILVLSGETTVDMLNTSGLAPTLTLNSISDIFSK